MVMLASNLINHPEAAVRQAFLRAARHHLAVGGKVLVERQDPEWLAKAQVGKQGSVGGVSLFVESAEREREHVRITLRYEMGSQAWRQSFEAVVLQEPEVESHACGGRLCWPHLVRQQEAVGTVARRMSLAKPNPLQGLPK